MQAILYYPFIEVPQSEWLTKALLYWDRVGTIVPDRWRWEPESLGPATLRLVQEGLVEQVFPQEADPRMFALYENWIARLTPAELQARRDRLQANDVLPIHEDKWIRMESGIEATIHMGLTKPQQDGPWLEVERTTALEFMTALALAICHPRGWTSEQLPGEPSTWVPATDVPQALACMVSGLLPAGKTPEVERELQLRVNGEVRAAEVRTVLLDRILPVPKKPIPVDEMVRFRQKYGDRLPAFRRDLETRIDTLVAIDDDVARQRAVDRLVEEASEQVKAVEAYLKEAGLRRIKRSPLLSLLKVVPAARAAVDATRDLAGALESDQGVASEPLAYLAFANVELRLAARFKGERGVPPLAEVFGRA